MAKKASVGLDIGSSGVHVAQLATKGGQPTLTNFGGVALPPGAVREGEVVDVAAVSAAIRQLWSDAGIKDKRVSLGVSNQRVVVRMIDVPFLEDTELRESLKFQVQEHIPIPVEDAELDYHRIEEHVGEGGSRMLRILLVAAHKEMVASHIAAVTGAGLRPSDVDLNPFAVMRAMQADSSAAGGSEVLVDIGAGVTNIVIHEAGTPKFVRILVLGGSDITDGLVSTLGVSFEDAEAIKVRTGLQPGSSDQAAQLIEQRAGRFVDEIRGSLDYYQAQTGSSRVSRVVLSGGGAKLAGLADRLASTVRLPVEIGHPMQYLPVKDTVYGPEQLADVEPVLATAIGLGLGGLE